MTDIHGTREELIAMIAMQKHEIECLKADLAWLKTEAKEALRVSGLNTLADRIVRLNAQLA